MSGSSKCPLIGRHLLKFIVALVVVAGCQSLISIQVFADNFATYPAKPNVVFILADDK